MDSFRKADGAGGADQAAEEAADALGAVDAGLAVFAEGDGLVAAVHAGRACVTPCLSPCEHYSKTFVRKDYRWAAAGSFLAIAPTGFPYGSQNTRRPDGSYAGY